MSPAPTTSVASVPSAWPSCAPKKPPAIRRTIGRALPSIGRISSGAWEAIAVAMASPTDAAIGSTTPFQTGSVRSTQSARLQASVRAVADGRSLTRSSHRSAVRSASATCRCCASPTLGSPPSPLAATARATSCAAVQLTGPSSPLVRSCCICCCTCANIACIPAASCGMPGMSARPGGSIARSCSGSIPASAPSPPSPNRARSIAASGSGSSSSRRRGRSGSLLMYHASLLRARDGPVSVLGGSRVARRRGGQRAGGRGRSPSSHGRGARPRA